MITVDPIHTYTSTIILRRRFGVGCPFATWKRLGEPTPKPCLKIMMLVYVWIGLTILSLVLYSLSFVFLLSHWVSSFQPNKRARSWSKFASIWCYMSTIDVCGTKPFNPFTSCYFAVLQRTECVNCFEKACRLRHGHQVSEIILGGHHAQFSGKRVRILLYGVNGKTVTSLSSGSSFDNF